MRLKTLVLSGMISLLACPVAAQRYYGAPNLNKGWGLGVSTGVMTLRGDVRPLGPGYAAELWVQRQINRVWDSRFTVSSGINFGLDLTPSQNTRFNPAYNGEYYPAIRYDSAAVVYHNYRHWGNQAAFNLRLNLNRIFIREGASSWDFYLSAGVGAYFYNTKTNLTNEQGAIYDYSNISSASPAVTQSRLTALLDNTYESFAQNDAFLKPVVGNFIVNASLPLGAGLYFRTGDNWGLGLEAQIIFSQDDLLDGQMWTPDNQPTGKGDAIGRAFISIGYHW